MQGLSMNQMRLNVKVMMLGLVVCMGMPMRADRNNSAMIAGAVGVTAVAVGTAVYMSYRESNASKIERATKIMNTYCGQITQSLSLYRDGKNMNAAINATGSLKSDMAVAYNSLSTIHAELLSRYKSLIAPWNWTKDMKEACEEVRLFIWKTKLVSLLLVAQEARDMLDTHILTIDRILALLSNSAKFYEILKNNSPLKKELLLVAQCARNLKHDLESRSFLNEVIMSYEYGVAIEKTERALGDFIQKINLLLMLMKYTACFVPDISEDALIKAVRVICGKESSYPVMHVVDKLGNDIEQINKMTVYVSCEQICLDMLDKLRTQLIQSEQQAIERQAYENYLQQQRLAAAAEAQARAVQAQAVATKAQADAQREQAWAQSRQAAALEERNRIERNKEK